MASLIQDLDPPAVDDDVSLLSGPETPGLQALPPGLAEPAAVQVLGVYKGYGKGRKHIPVLQNMDMTVPKGAIYGLLGPSGCGKTTLLKVIIGRLQVEQGRVISLGHRPGSLGHEVPGKRVGYMPQELALFNQFTISETLFYFGRLANMKSEHIEERTDFLISFLHLPDKNRQIDQLSGGQQRRSSFAVALLQEPELLILDEPTVGVDPLLRMRIWEHLIHISKTSKTTIIITTHYIEEARQAHRVGLMRNGRLLAEAPPSELLRIHELSSLEDVFLKLCEQDQVGDIEQSENGTVDQVQITRPCNAAKVRKPINQEEDDDERLLGSENVFFEEKVSCAARLKNFLPVWKNVFALIIKNFIIMRRQIGFLIFEFLLPSFQIILFCTCVGRAPRDLNMATFNEDTEPLGHMFLQFIDNSTIHQLNFSDFNTSIQSVRDGEMWGVIHIPETFTADFTKRYRPGSIIDNDTLYGSTVHLYLDMTNQEIYVTIQQKLLQAFQQFAEHLLVEFHLNPGVADLPVKIEEAVYGDLNPSFTNFMAPGIILSITFFMATGLTALSFVLERKQGLLERSFVAGVNAGEVMISHVCTQLLVMCVQVAGLLVFTLWVFKVPNEGYLVLVIALALFQGFTGMALGMLISAVCEEENSAIQAAIGSMYPSMLLSGIIWPIQSMPPGLRYFSYSLPMTYAAEAMRSILSRGWGLERIQVLAGFLMSIGWGWGLLAIALIILKVKGF